MDSPGGYRQGAEGTDPRQWRSENRLDTFTRMLSAAARRASLGLILLIDELSEFLRSKPSPQALTRMPGRCSSSVRWRAEARCGSWPPCRSPSNASGTCRRPSFERSRIDSPSKWRSRRSTSRRFSRGGSCACGRAPRRRSTLSTKGSARSSPVSRLPLTSSGRSIPSIRRRSLSWKGWAGCFPSIGASSISSIPALPGMQAAGYPLHLTRPAPELLAPDSIYDHFSQRLAEFSAFHIYPRHIVPHLDEVIERTLAEPRRPALCRRAVRMLRALSHPPDSDASHGGRAGGACLVQPRRTLTRA